MKENGTTIRKRSVHEQSKTASNGTGPAAALSAVQRWSGAQELARALEAPKLAELPRELVRELAFLPESGASGLLVERAPHHGAATDFRHHHVLGIARPEERVQNALKTELSRCGTRLQQLRCI